MTSTTRIAVVGSAYNPPTLGHADVIRQALAQADEVWLVPAYHHAWGKAMAPYQQRCAMAAALLADLAEPRVRLMAVEHLLGDGRPVYSYDLLDYLQREHATGQQLLLVLGPDNIAAIDKFHRSTELRQRWAILETRERVKVRSTLIRERLAQGLPINDMTTPSVVSYLAAHPLYPLPASAADGGSA